MEFPTRFDFKTAESRWHEYWIEKRLFHSEPDPDRPKFSMVVPPPNVTGYLHVGHALDNGYQDFLARFKRSQGYNVCWVPGTDHAGIATQNVVERTLLKEEGITRDQIGREEFLKRVWAWKKSRGGRIIEQLKRMGCSCDWERERFTMDPELSEQVRNCFSHLYREGLVYRGVYPVNWCPRCETALANDEVEHRETAGSMYYLRYQIKDSEPAKYLVVATTRPETVFGDVAVAFNPEDARYQGLEGLELRVPGTDRYVPLIPDSHPKPEFGTGLVKITPCHDKDDYQVGRRHDLPHLHVIDSKGRLTNTETKYDGLDRMDARTLFIAQLEKDGLVEKIESHTNQVGECYRCHTVTETNVSPQWFVKMQTLANRALEMVSKGDTKMVPKHHEKIFRHWLTECDDWCISRQIWWGHPVPISYCQKCGHAQLSDKKAETTGCEDCGHSELKLDEDVLDTWFSSWLWPFSVFSPEEQDYYFPLDTLVTGSDILFFWVARMMMASGELKSKAPFSQVFLHGIVRDAKGDKISKSSGNAIDPLEIIDEVGADAMRFTLMITTPLGGDTKISRDSFQLGSTLCTKLWNSVRFCLQKVSDPINPDSISKCDGLDLWIQATFNEMRNEYLSLLERFAFAEALTVLRTFFWEKFCNGYLELCKFKIESLETQQMLLKLLRNLLVMFHPVMPFITEELWSRTDTLVLPEAESKTESIMQASFPSPFMIQAESKGIHPKEYDHLWTLVARIRSLKSRYGLTMKDEKGILVLQLNPAILGWDQIMKKNLDLLQKMTKSRMIVLGCFATGSRSYNIDYDEYQLSLIDDGTLNYEHLKKQITQRLNGLEKNLEKLTSHLEGAKSEKKRKKIQIKLASNNEEKKRLQTQLASYM